ncbi:MAG: Ig-like domain-containing protein [Anaerovoracaceae bacterium]
MMNLLTKIVKSNIISRVSIYFIIFLIAISLIISPVEAAVKLKKIQITVPSGKNYSMTEGKTKKLKVKVLPKSLAKRVKWSSANKKVVTVTKKGKIKAIKPGKAKITASIGKKKVSILVSVKAKNKGEPDIILPPIINELTEIEKLQAALGGKSKASINSNTLTLIADATISPLSNFIVDNGIKLIVPEGRVLRGLMLKVGKRGDVFCKGEINSFHILAEEGAKLHTGAAAQIISSSNFVAENTTLFEKARANSAYIGEQSNWSRKTLSEAEQLAYIININSKDDNQPAVCENNLVKITKSTTISALTILQNLSLDISEGCTLTIEGKRKTAKLILNDAAEIIGAGSVKLINAELVQSTADLNPRIITTDASVYIILAGVHKGKYYFATDTRTWQQETAEAKAQQIAKEINKEFSGSIRVEDNQIIMQKSLTLSKDLVVTEGIEYQLNGYDLQLKATLCNKGRISGKGNIIVDTKYLESSNMLYNSGTIDIDGKIIGKIKGANFENSGIIKTMNESGFFDNNGEKAKDLKGNFMWKSISSNDDGFWIEVE